MNQKNKVGFTFNLINPIFIQDKEPIINNILLTDSLYTQGNICLAYYREVFHTENCHHYFCSKCLQVWTETKKECPVCRKTFSRIFPK